MNIYVTSEQIGLQGYWITDILAGISKEALKKNITILDYNGTKPEITDESTRPLVLAIGYSYQWMESTCHELIRQGVEPILVNAGKDTYTELLDASGFIGFNHKKDLYNIISYLLHNKRQKIAFFGAHDDTHADNIKIEEFLAITKHLGLPITDADVYKDVCLADCAKSLELNLNKYNSIICSSDSAAVFLLKRLEENNIKVPEDIYIVGFGNSLTAAATKPSISTVECDFFELGRQAVKLHQFLQRNGDIKCSSVLIEGRLIERGSTAFHKFKKAKPKKSFNDKIPRYDADPDIMQVLQIEELLRMWDDIDRSIVDKLLKGQTISAIADGLFISVSAVKYRIKKMLIVADLKNKEALIKVLKYYDVV